MQNLETVKTKWLAAAAAAASPAALEEVRVKALGKSGEISTLMKGLGAMAPDERRAAGAALNAVKDSVAAAIEARKTALQDSELDERLKTERVDVTLPVRPESDGRLHPISQTVDEIVAIFGAMGFRVAEGPDIEDDFHNFTALNIPADHPALGIENIHAHEQRLLSLATEKLLKVPGLTIIGTALEKASVISFVLDGIHPHDLGTILDAEGVAVRTGHHCAQPVMERFDLPATVRASFGLYNTHEDIDQMIAGLRTVQRIFG